MKLLSRDDQRRSTHMWQLCFNCSESMGSWSKLLGSALEALSTLIASIQPGPETQKWARCEALEAAIGYPGLWHTLEAIPRTQAFALWAHSERHGLGCRMLPLVWPVTFGRGHAVFSADPRYCSFLQGEEQWWQLWLKVLQSVTSKASVCWLWLSNGFSHRLNFCKHEKARPPCSFTRGYLHHSSGISG